MKTLLYIGILFLASVSVATGLSSCKPKCPSPNGSETFEIRKGAESGLLDFTGNDTLSFIKNNKDTVRFIGTGMQKYYTSATLPYGDCPRDYTYANRKVVFTNANDGDIVFHLYAIASGQVGYELVFKKPLIGPIETNNITAGGTLSSLNIKGRYFNYVIAMGKNNDSAYLNIASGDLPIYRLVRIKLDNNIYEVNPY